MKRNIFNLSFIPAVFILFLLSVILLGCESSKEKDDEQTVKTKKEQKEEIKNLPNWFLNPPISNDVIYATGYAKKKSMQLALDTATDWARQEISRIIQTKVSTMTKQFLEEAGVDNNSQLTEFSSVVSKSIASNTLSGSKVKERHVKQIGDKIAAYVLVEVSIKDLNAGIDAMVKENAADYSRLKANKSFDDLKNELEELKSSKDFENPKQPDYEE